MATARETAEKLVEGVNSIVGGGLEYRAAVGGEIFDLLIGTDPTALVRDIKGVPAELVEVIGDGIKEAVVAQILARWGKEFDEPEPL